MARTISQIETEIINAKNADSNLNALSSSSSTAIWRLWVYIQAVAIKTLEELFDDHKEDIETILDTRIPGTGSWYAEKMLEFQKGDQLVVEDGVPQYPTIDESKQIITRSAYAEDEANNLLTLKVAKGDPGNEQALSSSELVQAENYLDEFQYAGTNINLVSLAADLIKITVTVYYDGIFDSSTVFSNVETKLNDYIKNLPFDGVVRVQDIAEAIASAEGVIDLSDPTVEVKPDGGTYTTVNWAAITSAGYIAEDTSSGNSFSDTITMDEYTEADPQTL